LKNKICLTKNKNRIICFFHTKANFLYTKSIFKFILGQFCFKNIQMSKLDIHKKTTIAFLIYLFVFNISYSQNDRLDKNFENINYYKLLFYNEMGQNYPQEKIKLPGIYPQPNYDLKTNLLSFQTEFTLKYPSAKTQIIFESGFSDQGMILINDQFIDQNIIKGNEGYSHTIPNDVLKEGANKITLLIIFHSPIWNFEGDIYIENGLEKIYLNGFWDHTIHKNLENNFQRKPTQGLDLLSFINFDLSRYTLNQYVDIDWSKTDLPITIETLYDDKYLNGLFCFRKSISLESIPEEGLILNIDKGIDDFDRFYVNGFLIGSTDCFSCKRNYKIPKEFLRKENMFTLFVVDKNGQGGILSPIFLKSKNNSIDISDQWFYRKLLELQMLVTLKNNIDSKSFFTKSDFKFYDMAGNELSFKSLLVKDDESNSIIILVLTVILLFIIVLFLFYRSNKINRLPINETAKEESVPKFIFIRADRANHKILIDDILSVEGKKDYVKLQLESKSYLVRKNLKTFLLDLPSSKFARISKSVAVNLEKISKIEKNIVYLNSEDYHIISKNYVNDINDLLTK